MSDFIYIAALFNFFLMCFKVFWHHWPPARANLHSIQNNEINEHKYWSRCSSVALVAIWALSSDSHILFSLLLVDIKIYFCMPFHWDEANVNFFSIFCTHFIDDVEIQQLFFSLFCLWFLMLPCCCFLRFEIPLFVEKMRWITKI